MASVYNDDRPESMEVRFTVRMTVGELTKLKRKAAREGDSASAVARRGILSEIEEDAPEPVPEASTPGVDAEQLRDLRVEVNRVGTNINQIAWKLNKGESIILVDRSATTAEGFSQDVKDTKAVLMNVQDLLGGTIRPQKP